MHTIEFVYVLGIANANHHPNPLRNPGPFPLTKSRTILPSSFATPTLRTVRRIRKKEWSSTIKVSFEVKDGKAILRIAMRWRKNTRSTFGLYEGDSGGKCLASDLIASEEVDCIST